ncbi:hypothetical protein AYO21_11331 [Fonsecaea monophora]|uniref:Uncharacterized protein n=1 Tax=Fonsecaea monophora TaxID=254056 RepID=A0A177EU49_9EURO|nr:hypothetical protein AYO21_11331 [Fonsecaea monophora]KAH0831531.1 putative sterigmatocystin biosynthesis monooxygenase stcW [Fonsecaea pedrosoi]OAG34509.1 hypothetical protein AYO21_11331 [Fonsecaea monophora]
MALTVEQIPMANKVESQQPDVAVKVQFPNDDLVHPKHSAISELKFESPTTASGSSAPQPPSVEDILEQPLGTCDHVRIIIIGAGASGLNMIRSMRKHLENFELTVYEKNPEVGGTWYENRYPGCKCDIPSHNYQFSWRPNPTWSAFFAGAPEIQKYLKTLTEEEQLQTSIKLGYQVVRADWNEGDGLWNVKVKNLATGEIIDDHCNFLLNASGILNNWKWPDIKGLHSYKGQLIHSADWPREYDFTGKTVAVIGNGSSGVQIVPAIQPEVGKLIHFIRSPTWIAPSHLERMSLSPKGSVLTEIELQGEAFSQQQIDQFTKDPAYYHEFVKSVEAYTNAKFKGTVNHLPEATMAKELMTAHMIERLGDDRRLIDFLIPDFPVGCRRITPGVGYLESLRKPNVQVVTDSIIEINPEGLLTSTGEEFKVDVIVCATGFDVSFCPRFPVIGRDGKNLQDLWKEQLPAAYMSCLIPEMPNYFVFLGPNAPIGHGSVLTITEHVAKFMIKIIRKCQTQGIKAISPKKDAVEEFLEHVQKFMPRTAWSGNCRSWFKNGRATGPVTALHPGSRIHWFHMLEDFRGEDFDYVRRTRNRYAYLGNGFSIREMEGGDQTWYLDHPDVLF